MRTRDDISVSKPTIVNLLREGADASSVCLHNNAIDLVAKHHVCDRIKEQSDAFTRGVSGILHHLQLKLKSLQLTKYHLIKSSYGK